MTSLVPSDLTGDPGLGAFVDNETPGGGYFPLLASSPAIDRGNNEVCATDPILRKDQLGQPRVGVCDIGAIEFQRAATIAINIKPQKINLKRNETIKVTVFGDDNFDPSTIDVTSVRFGATGIEALPIAAVTKRHQGGGSDLILHFKLRDTGIECGDASASMTGQIYGGPSIFGSEPITTVGCKKNQYRIG